MPVKEVRNMSGNIMGYKWGETGKVYRTREQAEKQGKAIYAAGYNKSKDNK